MGQAKAKQWQAVRRQRPLDEQAVADYKRLMQSGSAAR